MGTRRQTSHRNGGGRRSGCFKCGKGGHLARDCPSNNHSGRGSGPRNVIASHPRNDERRFFDKVTKDVNSDISSASEAKRLMIAALGFAASEGAPALLYRLNEDAGSGALRKCVEYITDPNLFKEGFLPLIDRLAQDDLNKPVYEIPMNTLLSKLYKLPFFVPSIKALFQDWISHSQNDERTSLAWFFSKICLSNEDARKNEGIVAIADELAKSGCGDHLQVILGGSSPKISLSQIRAAQTESPGGRHDNDHIDFRSIEVIPTCQEFLCDAEPYLPAPLAKDETTEASILDRQFRLLREDIIGPSKDEMDDPKKQQRDIFYGARPVSVETGAAVFHERGQSKVRIIGETDPCIMFKVNLPTWFRVNNMKHKEKEDYWEKNKRILPRDALVCLERKTGENTWIPIRLGTIVRREVKELAQGQPLVGISFPSGEDLKNTLAEISDRSIPPTRLFVVSADLFAYQPILRGLQMMTSIPFKDEIVNSNPSLPAPDQVCEIPTCFEDRVKMLDSGQRLALDKALSDRVVLIQGPPGCGKTHCGVLIAEVLLASTDNTMLIVTYTNHALDDFLLELLDAGISDIVRLGGRSKCERLSEYNLRELGRSDKCPFSRDQTRRFAQLKETIEEAEKDVLRLSRIIGREIGQNWWNLVEPHLKTHHHDSWKQLSVLQNDIVDKDGFRTAGIEGTDTLWKCWVKNKAPPSVLKDRAKGNLWDLSPDNRRRQKIAWQHEIYENEREELSLALQTIKTARDEIKGLQQITDASILAKARVIGCTTTKAAMCKSLLNGVNAGMILVEEAAEIHEAHVLTSLNPSAKRLIMIGDHKQLRPKCAHYPLSVESGRGIDLNRSLFERLAMAHPISTLGTQHRMHPDISGIPKLTTYENLLDAPSVTDHPSIRGLGPSRVIFINHNTPEDIQHVDVMESVSKTNAYERRMIIKTVHYIIKQGYSPDDIVVLTPYLGQMMKLQAELANHFSISVDERDLNEANKNLRGDEAFSSDLETAKKKVSQSNTSIRVATIDNYQGEESKIVLISLVRSNESGQIGFLREPERVNVMLSRARDCEIIIGNKMTLEQAKGSENPLRGGALWKKIFSYLESKGSIFEGLPVACQNHGVKRVLRHPDEFDTLCKDGGCTEKCGKLLECSHPCQYFCHPGACGKCEVVCFDVCPRGHKLKKICGDEKLPKCKRKITWRCPMNHISCGPCHEGIFSRECCVCVSLQREEDEHMRREEELNQILTDEQKKLSLVKHELELAQKADIHRQEVQSLKTEYALAQKSLDRLQSKWDFDQSCASGIDADASKANILTTNVFTLLQKESSLSLSQLPSKYKDEFGSSITKDAGPEKKKPRKLKEILHSLSFCEVFSEKSGKKSTEYRVRLREESPSIASQQPPLKVQKPDPSSNFLNSKNSPDKDIISVGDGEQNKCLDEFAPPILSTKDSSEPSHDQIPNRVAPILPPSAPKQLSRNAVSSSTNIRHVIQRYNTDGALKTDDLLDEFSDESIAIDAIRFLIEMELNPGGDLTSPEYTDSPCNLSNAICLTAKALDIKNKYPLQAKDFAEKALLIASNCNHVDEVFPQNWKDELKSIVEAPIKNRVSLSTSQGKRANSSEAAWLEIERKDCNAPPVMRYSILPMIGLEAVKNSLIGVYQRVKLAQEQGDGVASSYNVRFEGNAGTGKTSIARHYGLFLQQLMVLPEGSVFHETSGAKLINGGVKSLQDVLQDVKDKKGGVVFVDEAYQLVSDQQGKKVLDFILPLAESLETEYGSLVWIFAGYKKQMEKLFEHNQGLPSRFPNRFVFEDYSDEELEMIFSDMLVYNPPNMKSSEKKGDDKKNKSKSPMISSSYPSRINNYPPANGSVKKCRFGYQWTYINHSGWTDKYGNRTVDPEAVGTNLSNLVDSKGEMWTIDGNSKWISGSGITQDHYPGSPIPIKAAKRQKRKTPFHCDKQHLSLAVKRLGRQRGERGFGNARSVRVLFDLVRDRQAIRIARERSKLMNPDIFLLSKCDLLGPDITPDSLKKSNAWSKLAKLEGLLPVKESVEQLFKLVLQNAKREERGEEPLGVSLNRLFLGNPGTGKTTVAAIYGQILSDLGLLSKGEVILKSASDFVGDHLGESEKTTQAILKSAHGCVLVIDEAYSLYTGNSTGSGSNDPYKTAVIDTIVEHVQARPGADLAVVMIGYQDEMETMMSNVNPGLSRRFQIDEAFYFPDFDDAALVRIMMASAKERGLKLDLKVAKRAIRTLARSRARPHFGNAGAVDNLLSKGVIRMQARDGRGNIDKLELEDFDYEGDGPNTTALDSLFDHMIGCKAVKEKMNELKNTVIFSQAQGKDAASCGVSFNYLFLGNPGTGKTVTARLMGKMFHGLGLLPGTDLVEAKASDLVTGYTGQAGKCTRSILRKSLGGVLFIDEAYQLDPSRGGPFMSEAVDELVGALTEEEFKDKLLVILAGYDQDMENMLKTNPGLKSRFSERVHFDDFGPDSVIELLRAELERKNIPLSSNVEAEELMGLAQRLIDESGNSFGNGRDVITWTNYAYKEVAKNFSCASRKASEIASFESSMQDIETALNKILESRRTRKDGQTCSAFRNATMESSGQICKDPPPMRVALSSKTAIAEAETESTKSIVEPVDLAENLFSCFDSSVLQSLQRAIDDLDLGSEEGAKRLAKLDPSSQEFKDLVDLLMNGTGLDRDSAKGKLLKWQSLQKDLSAMIEEQKAKSKSLGARPIWRCAVCGRADKPWIACYVAPFIVGYEKLPLE